MPEVEINTQAFGEKKNICQPDVCFDDVDSSVACSQITVFNPTVMYYARLTFVWACSSSSVVHCIFCLTYVNKCIIPFRRPLCRYVSPWNFRYIVFKNKSVVKRV